MRPKETIPGLLGGLEALKARLAGRDYAARTAAKLKADRPQAGRGDRLLRAKGAAEILEMTEDYLRHHAKDLPFTVRPVLRKLRFSLLGIERFIRQQKNL
ncbi:MAG: hypothetical protein HY717_06140 [Planctomycetes bacterium]|nr:hypothetical protein [Planctomycetota bacterium]